MRTLTQLLFARPSQQEVDEQIGKMHQTIIYGPNRSVNKSHFEAYDWLMRFRKTKWYQDSQNYTDGSRRRIENAAAWK